MRPMRCPYCERLLAPNDVEMWDSFPCPRCHKWLRVRRNYGARLARIIGVTVGLWILLPILIKHIAAMTPLKHINVGLEFSGIATMVGAIDEAILRYLPKQIEAAGQGGLVV